MQIHQGPLFTWFSPMMIYHFMHATWDIYGYLMVYAMLTVYSGNYAMQWNLFGLQIYRYAKESVCMGIQILCKRKMT